MHAERPSHTDTRRSPEAGPRESIDLMRTVLVTFTAVAVVGTGAWLLARHFGPRDPTPDNIMRWLAYGTCGAVGLFVLITVLQGRHETRALRRVVAEDLRDCLPITDEEFGNQFFEPSRAALAARLCRLLADGLDCDLAGMMPADDFEKWLYLFPGPDSAADIFFEELAIEHQLKRGLPWPARFGSFNALIKFVAEHRAAEYPTQRPISRSCAASTAEPAGHRVLAQRDRGDAAAD